MAAIDKFSSMGAKLVKSTQNLVRAGGKSRGKHHKEASRNLERGRKFYNQKDFKKAEELFSRAAHLDPEYALAHYYLGLARYKLDKYKGALAAWQKSMESDPGSPAAYKAEKKINYVKKKLNSVIDEIRNAM